jgi:predicted nucleic acid-binding protein
VIYLDSSVVLAHLLMEERRPPDALWQQQLASSRLLGYEVWSRIHALGFGRSHGVAVRALLARVGMIEMDEPVLARALEPFPIPLRTLDALHLATIEFLHSQGDSVELASYDNRLLTAARALGVPLAAL